MLHATYDSSADLCPGPDSNRQRTRFELAFSAYWNTGLEAPLNLSDATDILCPWLASATVTTPSTTPRQRRVLVAEDEALIRLDLKEMLEEEGYDVVGEAADGEQAVKLAQELRPDLVILDVKMPVLDGISAAEQIVAGRIAPVVMLTAFSQRDLVERAVEAGAMAYLVKPFAKSDLLPTIEVAVSRHAQLAALEGEVADLTERLETRKLVDRAKSRLQTDRGMTEPEAFRWIQKTSMDRRTSMRAVRRRGTRRGRTGRDPDRSPRSRHGQEVSRGAGNALGCPRPARSSAGLGRRVRLGFEQWREQVCASPFRRRHRHSGGAQRDRRRGLWEVSNSSGGSGSSGSGKTVVIGMSAPLTGSLSALGLGMKNSVDLAVKQANQANKISGWTIKFDPQDDTADANVGGQVAARLAR